ncbi:MAG: flavin reductase family protein, partial [Gallionellaceae bacterium]|nr:flavin reductase family protein [Gallionellaceae bacterium]
MAKKTIPLSGVYCLLEPGPVVLVTTAHKGKADIMTQSWHTMMEFEPPLVGCVISGRNHSFEALTKTKECVLSIPSVELAKQVVGIGNCSGSKVDKFRKFKLTAMPASKVAAPLIAECFANLECR